MLYDGGKEIDNEEDQELIETLEGLKEIKLARLYSFLFLLKRLVLVIAIVLVPSSQSSFANKILFLLLLQGGHIVYAIYIRSFEKRKDQAVEILNEIVYFALLILLIKFYSEEKWTNFAIHLYIGIIL